MNALLVIFFLSYLTYSIFYNFSFILLYALLLFLYIIFTQVLYFKTPFDKMRNKATVASWNSPSDPHLYAKIKLNVTKIDDYLNKISTKDRKITYTLYTIKLMSIVLSKFPSLNTYIKYGVINSKQSVDLCCLVTVGEGKDLANATIKETEKKTVFQIHDELQDSVKSFRKEKNVDHNKKNKIANKIPSFLLSPLIQITSYLSSIGFSFKAIGLKPFEFGSCVITSIGSIGISDGYPPIPPPAFCPILLSICKKENKYYYNKEGEVLEKAILSLNFTADFRFVESKTIKGFIDEIKRIGESPDIFNEEMNKICKKDL